MGRSIVPVAPESLMKASIVIPCYNAEKHVRETIASARAQTIRDIEIICVDDGSTDETLLVLKQLAQEDDRIKVIEHPNGGEGPCRETGRIAATGEWLYFLDADDLMLPNLLSHAIMRGEATEADVVVFRTSELDSQTGETRRFPGCFDTSWLNLGPEERWFAPREHPERIFNSFQNWVHNKLYRASFVEEHRLAFQSLHRNADILFTCRALAEASRIALLDEELHLYRVNNPQSALFTADAWPLDFYVAFLALRSSLELHKTWELYRASFVNWAEEAVAMSLWRARSYESFLSIASTMRIEGLHRLGIDELAGENAYSELRHEQCAAIACMDSAELAFYYFALERRHMQDLETELSYLRRSSDERVAALEGSVSLKVGRAVTALPRAALNALRRHS